MYRGPHPLAIGGDSTAIVDMSHSQVKLSTKSFDNESAAIVAGAMATLQVRELSPTA